ncbi:Integral membrane protein [Amycolatopsis camponoti]|uniref:Integral membrane protein n=1 Tax=Amycolatopsis camponoti TaxID=2606593 RepID=A0A6I8MAL2_9PSEU|nr:M56 family metallopeptidase [Amycolatopsis camponoti]VVJ24908.1 Integral membrane protein [Amycolatopsis camponoti]
MTTDLLIPLLLPSLAWPAARLVEPRLPPRAASWLLTGACLVLAAGSTAALALLAFSGLSLIPAVASLGSWSPQAFRAESGVDVPVSIASGAVLAAVVILLARTIVRYVRWARRVSRELDEHGRDGVVLLSGAEAVAFAVPGRGGRIAVSSGMLAALDPPERSALLAHERAHLASRHHLFLLALKVSSAVNPLLRPLCAAAGFALERWADEAAAHRVGDRAVVAHAVAKAALAGRPHHGFALAATGGPVPRRVSALLTPTTGAHGLLPVVLLSALVIGIAGLSAQTALDSAADLHDGIEIAQADSDGH